MTLYEIIFSNFVPIVSKIAVCSGKDITLVDGAISLESGLHYNDSRTNLLSLVQSEKAIDLLSIAFEITSGTPILSKPIFTVLNMLAEFVESPFPLRGTDCLRAYLHHILDAITGLAPENLQWQSVNSMESGSSRSDTRSAASPAASSSKQIRARFKQLFRYTLLHRVSTMFTIFPH